MDNDDKKKPEFKGKTDPNERHKRKSKFYDPLRTPPRRPSPIIQDLDKRPDFHITRNDAEYANINKPHVPKEDYEIMYPSMIQEMMFSAPKDDSWKGNDWECMMPRPKIVIGPDVNEEETASKVAKITTETGVMTDGGYNWKTYDFVHPHSHHGPGIFTIDHCPSREGSRRWMVTVLQPDCAGKRMDTGHCTMDEARQLFPGALAHRLHVDKWDEESPAAAIDTMWMWEFLTDEQRARKDERLEPSHPHGRW